MNPNDNLESAFHEDGFPEQPDGANDGSRDAFIVEAKDAATKSDVGETWFVHAPEKGPGTPNAVRSLLGNANTEETSEESAA